MKAPSWRLTDVEPGDKLHFHTEEYHRSDWEGPRDFDITVVRMNRTTNFGVVITSKEQIPANANKREQAKLARDYPSIAFNDHWYIEDDWTITPVVEVTNG